MIMGLPGAGDCKLCCAGPLTKVQETVMALGMGWDVATAA